VTGPDPSIHVVAGVGHHRWWLDTAERIPACSPAGPCGRVEESGQTRPAR
jgi:hypothetical protein